MADQTPATPLSIEQRAARTLRVYGYGPMTIPVESMDSEELARFAACVDDQGNQVEGSREMFVQAWHDYFDARKAAADQPPAA